MSAIVAPHNARHQHFCEIVVDRLIKAGADVNVADKVSYHQAPYYNN